MALVIADRVQETTTTTGTGTITLAGAASGYQSFAAIGNGNTCYYTIISGTAWEVGIGTYSTTGPTLARTTILSSSNSNTAISLTGTSTVFATYPAERAVYTDASNIFTLPAGTTAIPPQKFTSGTNLTTATAGSVEYDGRVQYFTPIGTQRGVVPGAQFYRLETALAGASVTTVQSAFGVGVTLSSSTVYHFEALISLVKPSGATTSHTVSLGFGGTATINNILYQTSSVWDSGGIPQVDSTSDTSISAQLAPTPATVSAGAAAFTASFVVRGTISVNAGGTLIPQYQTSSAVGIYSTQPGSFFLIYPIGASGSNTSIGTWA